MASASSSGAALGICPLPFVPSAKIGRRIRVQPGQIAGAEDSRRATSIPATKVPCVQAMLSKREQEPRTSAGTSLMLDCERSGCWRKTGPSISATASSRRPWLRNINGGSRTSCRGSMAHPICQNTTPEWRLYHTIALIECQAARESSNVLRRRWTRDAKLRSKRLFGDQMIQRGSKAGHELVHLEFRRAQNQRRHRIEGLSGIV